MQSCRTAWLLLFFISCSELGVSPSEDMAAHEAENERPVKAAKLTDPSEARRFIYCVLDIGRPPGNPLEGSKNRLKLIGWGVAYSNTCSFIVLFHHTLLQVFWNDICGILCGSPCSGMIPVSTLLYLKRLASVSPLQHDCAPTVSTVLALEKPALKTCLITCQSRGPIYCNTCACLCIRVPCTCIYI